LELVAQTGLPRQHLIGSGPELSRMVVMVVQTGDLPSMLDEVSEFVDVPRYYWRSITYDRYFGRGWMTTNTDEADYRAGESVLSPDTENTRQVRQHVHVVSDSLGGLVYVAGNLITMDHDYTVAMRPPGEVFAVTSEALDFRADSLIPVYTEEQLQSVSTNYPSWISDRYLQLPESTTDRVLELARDLTATEPTPYDRAVAIEQYLRKFEYTLDVPTPGLRDDIADYFLFELQKGYCDYYATSMVVLARAAGLPARLVVGYVSGTYDFFNARYIVTEADAHAWVEVYFPEVGWIEFEPTGGRPPIDRLTDEDAYVWPEDFTFEPLVGSNSFRISRIDLWQWVLILGSSAVVITLFATTADTIVLFVNKTPAWMMTRLYHRLCQNARHIEAFIHDGDTPHEVLEAFTKRIDVIVREREVSTEFISASVDLAGMLVDSYIKLWYSPRTEMPRAERWEVAWLWWNLRWRLWLAWLLRRPRKERAPMPTAESSTPPPDRYVQRQPPTR
jgi:transglutaminase-like putative cysteine protease